MSGHSNSSVLTRRQLLGMDGSHLVQASVGPAGATALLHTDAAQAFAAMREAARQEGIGLSVASGFRSFDRQLAIWNTKARGERACHDDAGNRLDLASMEAWDAVQAILRFSALPGTSRHHWGSDMDVFDEKAVPCDYRLQLVAEEYAEQGPFHAMHNWLEQRAGEFGFFRPYREDRGGIAPEPWHLSYRPLAEQCENAMSASQWAQQTEAVDLAYKETVMAKLHDIFERFVQIP